MQAVTGTDLRRPDPGAFRCPPHRGFSRRDVEADGRLTLSGGFVIIVDSKGLDA